MKRFLVVAMICGAMATSSLAVDTFTPSQADLLAFSDLAAPFTQDGDFSGFGVFLVPGPDPGYGALTMQGVVGYHGDKAGSAGVLDFVGVGNGGFDLTGYDAVALMVANDNNQGWEYRLFANDGSSTAYSNGGLWTPLASGASTVLSVDLASLTTLNSVTLGFQVGRSDQADNFHTSASPVIPAPGALLLAGIGAGIVGWVRRRQAL